LAIGYWLSAISYFPPSEIRGNRPISAFPQQIVVELTNLLPKTPIGPQPNNPLTKKEMSFPGQ
jgi:hypothetical protein